MLMSVTNSMKYIYFSEDDRQTLTWSMYLKHFM